MAKVYWVLGHSVERHLGQKQFYRAVVVAMLVERSLPTPQIRGLNPDSGKILLTDCAILIEKVKIKKKRPIMTRLKKLCIIRHKQTGR